jgi:hypothetical protein
MNSSEYGKEPGHSASFESEQEWRDRLKSILLLDYGHSVLTEVSYRNPEDRGRIDLYVRTSSRWAAHPLFPVIGIECKLLAGQGMGWLIDSADQMRRYMRQDNLFKKDGRLLDPPSICLVATPESWHEGIVYRWNGSVSNGGAKICCWETMTHIFQRILLKSGCSILLNKRFQSNKGGGPIRNYYLGE